VSEQNPAPLILTLALDAASTTRFEALRREHFPPGRNLVPAHLTLFHHLPGDHLADITPAIAAACREHGPFAAEVTGLRFLGRGVAYAVESPELRVLRAGLAHAWAPWLTPQDRQPFRPHVTVQNKAAPAEARALLERLGAGLAPFPVRAEGLLLWRYLGGPWETAGRYPFAG
jgi:2'-5' RNA ligase